MIHKIISGGQTGADQGGLLAAVELGIATGGVAPRGWKTEVGPNPSLAKFGLVESKSLDYRVRTLTNIFESDATVIFGVASPGSTLTKTICLELGKPWMWIFYPDIEFTGVDRDFLKFVSTVKILNVAGNRASKYPNIQDAVKYYLIRQLRQLSE